MPKFAYDIIGDSKQAIFLEDLCMKFHCMSITNAAELVICDLIDRKLINKSKRVFYKDTEGQVDEIVHDGVKFVAFAPGENYEANLQH